MNLISPNHEYITYDFLHYYDKNANTQAIQFALLITSCFVLGIHIYKQKISAKIENKFTTFTRDKLTNISVLKIFSFLIVFTTFPIELYISINKLIIGFTSGYLETYDFYVSGIIIQLSKFYLIGFILLLFIYKNHRWKSLSIFIFLVSYNCVLMLSGNRGMQVITILLLFFIYFKFIQPIGIKGGVLLLLFGCIGIFFITILTKIRTYGFDNLSDLISAMFNVESNPIIAILDEFGFSLYSVSLCFSKQPEIIPFAHGSTYIYSFASILPNISTLTESWNFMAVFTNTLTVGENIGGSIIGELYYNFSYFATIFACFFGIMIAFISDLFNYSAVKERLLFLSYLILPTITILWWVRDSFANTPRMVFYQLIYLSFMYFISKFICKHIKKLFKKEN